MQPPRAKSAPVSRSKVKRNNAIKEIEEWVTGGRSGEPETSRIHSGQLAENITEERLLRARIMELGKERFKILSKCDHEIQTFKDKQKKKGFAFKKIRPKSANIVPDKLTIKSDGETEPRPHVIRPKTVQFEPTLSRGEYLSTGNVDSRPKTVPAKMHFLTSNTTLEEWNPIAMTTDWSRPSTAAGANSYSRPGSVINMSSFQNSVKDSIEIGTANDPRFEKLEKALSSNYVTACKYDVSSIIQNIEALRQQRKVGGKEARRELEIKIRTFMEENNIVF